MSPITQARPVTRVKGSHPPFQGERLRYMSCHKTGKHSRVIAQQPMKPEEQLDMR